jgi:hypothetical protein
MSDTRTIAMLALRLALNTLLLSAAAIAAVRFEAAAQSLDALLGLREIWGLAVMVWLAFLAAGALATTWSRHWLELFGPAVFLVIALFLLLSSAMFLTDGGDPSVMWSYLLPDLLGFIPGVVVVASGTVLGYFGARLWRQPSRALAR